MVPVQFPIDCASAVLAVDTSPIRSPQQVHSFLANSVLRGKELVEIGTRNGALDPLYCNSWHFRLVRCIA